jgi:hypothetical protein
LPPGRPAEQRPLVAKIRLSRGGAGEGNRTLDTKLGKLLLYH